MRANIMSAWLCGAAGAADELWAGAADAVDVDDDDCSVAELLHAPMVAIAASAATPVTTVLVLFTSCPFLGGCHAFATQPSEVR